MAQILTTGWERRRFSNRSLALVLAVGSTFAGGAATAVELGELSVQSQLGQPFRASIPFVLGPGERISADCIAIDDGPGASGLPGLGPTALRMVDNTIVLVGKTYIREPIVSAQLQFNCPAAPRIKREILALVDPRLDYKQSIDDAIIPLSSAPRRLHASAVEARPAAPASAAKAAPQRFAVTSASTARRQSAQLAPRQAIAEAPKAAKPSARPAARLDTLMDKPVAMIANGLRQELQAPGKPEAEPLPRAQSSRSSLADSPGFRPGIGTIDNLAALASASPAWLPYAAVLLLLSLMLYHRRAQNAYRVQPWKLVSDTDAMEASRGAKPVFTVQEHATVPQGASAREYVAFPMADEDDGDMHIVFDTTQERPAEALASKVNTAVLPTLTQSDACTYEVLEQEMTASEAMEFELAKAAAELAKTLEKLEVADANGNPAPSRHEH